MVLFGIMNKAKLRHAIYSTIKPDRELVVQYVKLLSDEARNLSAGERESRGDYRDSIRKFPQTKGEDIASEISSCLAQQEWIDWDTEPELEDIASIAGNLEINTEDGELWRALFSKVDQL